MLLPQLWHIHTAAAWTTRCCAAPAADCLLPLPPPPLATLLVSRSFLGRWQALRAVAGQLHNRLPHSGLLEPASAAYGSRRCHLSAVQAAGGQPTLNSPGSGDQRNVRSSIAAGRR